MARSFTTDREVAKTQEVFMKADITKIEGFETMTPEQQVEALKNYDFEAPKPEPNNAEVENLKKIIEKSNADAAEWKRKYRDTLSAQEKEAAEKAEREKTIMAELEGYKQRERISTYTSQLMASGVDAETAKKMAELLPEGVSADFFTLAKENHEKTLNSASKNAINTQPTLTPGQQPKPMTQEEKLYHAFAQGAGIEQ